MRDRIYVSHCVQPFAAKPTGGQTRHMSLRSGRSPARDQVEVLIFLRQPAEVAVAIGPNRCTCRAPARVDARLFPLAAGTVSAQATAADGRRTAVVSPLVVTNRPVVQDLQYHFASSG